MPKRVVTEEQKIKNRQRVREWAKRNPERKRENTRKAMRKYMAKGEVVMRMLSETRRQQIRQRRRELITPKRIYKNYRHDATKRNLAFELSLTDFTVIIESECHYCGRTERMGVDRVDNSKGYTNEPGQCVPCCTWCNIAKADGSKETFLRKMRAIHARHNAK